MIDPRAKLLVVDDVDDSRNTLATLLEMEGYVNVTTASNGSQAIDLLRNRQFDLVLLDAMLPDVDGSEILQRLNHEAKLSDVFVIVTAAMTELEGALRCISLGADDYVVRPFNPVLLKARVNACLEQKVLRDRIDAYVARIETELADARRLQLSMVPADFPAPTEARPVEIFATMDPAREVGGDLYDFYYREERHLCFFIGDVSDKGVPAALFMARTKDVVRLVSARYASSGHRISPSEIVSQVNYELCRDNDAAMFVTLFYGVIDTQTGECEFCNAGHNPPYLVRRDGSVAQVSGAKGRPVGLRNTSNYVSDRIKLEFGDSLFLYTDGVTEAINEKDELFGEEKLEQVLRSETSNTPKATISSIMTRISEFRGPAYQNDDITIFGLRRIRCSGAENGATPLSRQLDGSLEFAMGDAASR